MTSWQALCCKDELCEARSGHYGACDPNERAKAALANARRVSGDNMNIAIKAMSQLTEAQEMLQTLVDAANDDESLYITALPDHLLAAVRTLIDTQKATKLYE
tara:strand:+ start:843 stop:1151 length:309 start_codon:yes stop_codon:yes gene_type:complete